ncbi:uncharacterized protein [Venturia canescens]|uniref:uncharacterized protein n=1 Tax=Venturia canescens TaxID=32260 RepID=UPI001C9C6474|nr:uncharacterized protein LOC122416020 [Venturia canescens]
MEGRRYAAILLLIVGVIGIHSHPHSYNAPGNPDAESLDSVQRFDGHKTDYEFAADRQQDDLCSEVESLERESKRTKRSPPTWKHTGSNGSSPTKSVPRKTMANQLRKEREDKFRAIMNSYKQQGLNSGQALMKANQEHPELADLVFSS